MLNIDRIRVFAGNAHPQLAKDICSHLGIPLGEASVGRFPDGEINLRINCDVRGADVFVVQPTCPPVNDNLFELLSFGDCLRRASADRISAVVPYFGYARKDRKDEGRVPINAKLVAYLITKAGAHRVVSIDLHAAQIQGFFDIPVDHLYARPVLLEAIGRLAIPDPVVVTPDVGGTRMARAYAKRLHADLAIVDKRRLSGTKTVIEHVIGDVEGRNCVIVDDMISTGGSISQAAEILRRFGARQIVIAVTHAVFCGPAVERLSAAPVDKILVTDTIPSCDPSPPQLQICSVAPLIASAVSSIHRAESVSCLFE